MQQGFISRLLGLGQGQLDDLVAGYFLALVVTHASLLSEATSAAPQRARRARRGIP